MLRESSRILLRMAKQEILNNFQAQTLKAASKSELSNYFYWSVGTALAYAYLQHRYSEDLDFLSEELLPDELVLALVKEISKQLNVDRTEQRKIYNRNEFIFFRKKQNLKLEFVYYPFINHKKPHILKEFGIKISSIEDIAINKVHALYERGEPKDVFDLYLILQKRKLTIRLLLRLVKEKFGTDIDYVQLNAQALKAIDRMKDIKPLMISKTLYKADEMRDFFQTEANKYLRKKVK
jgi:predicted nucleotidyltransferase component of viral defense system